MPRVLKLMFALPLSCRFANSLVSHLRAMTSNAPDGAIFSSGVVVVLVVEVLVVAVFVVVVLLVMVVPLAVVVVTV